MKAFVNRQTLPGGLITGNDGGAQQHCRLLHSNEKRKSYLAFAIIAAVLVGAVVAGIFLFQARRTKPTLQVASTSKPGAQPRMSAATRRLRVTLEEFGDFECMPCFILWPALRNLESDFGERLAVVFRQTRCLNMRRP